MSERPVTRKIDYTTGHGPFGPKLPQSYSQDTFADDENVVRVGDPYQIHCVGPVCHGSTLVVEDQTVFVNDLPIGVLAEALDCGCFVAQASQDVFAG